MCVRDHFKQGDMSFADFKKVINQLNDVVKIHLQGLGEPFLNREIFSMIDYAASRNIMVSVITNGTIFSDEVIGRIAKSDIFEIGVSIDAVDKRNYELIRVGANFERVMGGIKALNAALRKYGSKTKIFLAVTIMKSNVGSISEFVRLAKSLDILKIVFQRVQTKDDFVKYYKSDFRKSKEFVTSGDVEVVVKKAMPLAESLGVKILFEESKVRCKWPWRGIYVTWNGDITPCCMIVDPDSVQLGNILKEPIGRIWNSQRYRQLRNSVRRRAPMPCCAGCRAI